MSEQIVAATTTDEGALATASVDRTRNGDTFDNGGTLIAIGGGVYLTAGHVFYQYVNPDDPRVAESYTITVGQGLDTSYDVGVDASEFDTSFVNLGWGADGGSDVAAVLTTDTTDVSTPMIIYADPNEAAGTLTTFGYPGPNIDDYDGATMVEVTGNLTAGSH